jgi:hypothetical protein
MLALYHPYEPSPLQPLRWLSARFAAPLEPHMPILAPALVALAQHDAVPRKVFRVVIGVVLVDGLPADVHDIAIAEPVHALLEHAPGASQTSVHVPYNMCPQGPRALVPGRRGRYVDGRARNRRAPRQSLGAGRELTKVGVPN